MKFYDPHFKNGSIPKKVFLVKKTISQKFIKF